jgi:dynein heavy chain
MIMARTLRDMNLSKFVAQDIPLFLSLLKDIFPKQKDIPKKVYKEVETAVRKIIKERNLQDKQDWFIKIIQLYETSLVRHGFMVVGSVGSGKTTIMNTLTDALTDNGLTHKMTRMNPKSIKGQEMYGVMNTVTGEWVPGVFSEIWKKCNDKKNKHFSWIVCDGPVDAIWIENLNTVLDDNKILTLANAERIPMSDNTKMVFEVENLNNASPATVSRCGIIYVSATDLFWKPLIQTWCTDRAKERGQCNPDEEKWTLEFTEKYIEKTNMFVMLLRDYNYVMACPEVVRINQFLNLLTSLLQQYIQKQESVDKAAYEKLYLYCLAWSCGGLFETDEREKFHKFLESRNAPLPQAAAQRVGQDKETIFDYFVDEKTKQWK